MSIDLIKVAAALRLLADAIDKPTVASPTAAIANSEQLNAAVRKPRAPKSAASVAAPVAEAAPAPAIEAPAASATSPSEEEPAKEPTLDDVRAALVQCQTRKGSKEVPLTILKKYASTGTTGSLPKDKYAAVIAECASA
jgi:hypothetical protein